jgi:glycine dehydrogenase subunit 1
MVCQLTGMEVANASMYDGSSAVPEAAMMAARITKRDHILASRTVHPEYREVLATYLKHAGLPVSEFGYNKRGLVDIDDLKRQLDDRVAAVIIQTPNFFGILEHVAEIAHLVHASGALLIVAFTEAVALGLIEPPREADIVVGELQSFAIPPSYGGPYAGIIAAKEKYIRQLPGRLVGETLDAEGRRAFCLTLATREQHIRREKATSNICTNQALIALMATVFMTVYGKEGMRELAHQNLSKAHYLASKLPLKFDAPFFNEFVAASNGKSPERINGELLEKKILGGLPLERFYPELAGCVLLCATETAKRSEMDKVAEAWNQ